MFAKSKIIRLALGACLAAAWLPIGNGPLKPTQAKAWEVVRGGVIVRGGPIVSRPIVVGGPTVSAPVVTAPVVVNPPVVVSRLGYYPRYGGGYHLAGYGHWGYYHYHR